MFSTFHCGIFIDHKIETIMPLKTGKGSCLYKTIFFSLLQLIIIQKVSSQQISLSIKETLQKIEYHLPVLESYRQQATAAQQNISLAKNSSIPDLTVGYQINVATYNNITGMSYPGFLMPISGPPSQNNNMNFIPSSAAGALIKWNPFTFGKRSASIEKAEAQFIQANSNYNQQLFQYQYTALTNYFQALYYQQVIKSVKASIERNKVGLDQSLVLAKSGLKAGIDTSQFQSIIAQSEIDLLQTNRTYQQIITELKWLTGIEAPNATIFLSDACTYAPIAPQSDTTISVQHPYYQLLQSQKNITTAALKEIEKSWMPQLDFWGNLYARGSGVDANGMVDKMNGLGFSRTNAGIGLQLSFPVLQYSKVNIQKKQYQSFLKADDARLAQAKFDIGKQTEIALMQYWQDVKIAEKSPMLLNAARDVYQGLKMSYENGLIDFTRLSQAQYDLFKAEINDTNTKLQLWQSLLTVAMAKGDLHVFTDQLK